MSDDEDEGGGDDPIAAYAGQLEEFVARELVAS